MTTVNDRIRAERERRNISQEELAKRLGLSKSVVQRWEYGRGLPAKESLKKISQVFRKPVSYFTGNPEDDEVPLVSEMVAESMREPGHAEVRKALADLEAALDDIEAAKSRARLAQLVIKRLLDQRDR